MIILVLFTGLIGGIFVGAFLAFTHDLPQIRALETFRPQAVTRIYSADNVQLSELYMERRVPVPLEQIPFYLRAAVVATEDRKFFTHSGVDLKGITRAIIKDIQAGEFVEGASTITQQLAKTLFLTPRKSLVRKIKEAILAFQLERRYTKAEILELYLNQVYFGSGAYGVESAAAIYFGKSAGDLSLAECALIAGMPKSPSRYSPLVDPDQALKRRNVVLNQMLATGTISPDAYQRAITEELRIKTKGKKADRAPYFVEYIKKFLEDELGASRLYKGGLSIYTTLNFELQLAAEKAVTDGLSDLQSRMLANYLAEADPQAALIALDVNSGGILSMVGGKDFNESAFNRAVDGKRQPGSAFKPIIYAYAVEQGFPQNKLILDAPIVFKGAQAGNDWRPENFSGKYLGEITLRKALTISQNIPAVRLIEMLGPHSVSRFANHLGIESKLEPNLALALGTSEITLMELTAAFAVFARNGVFIKPFGVVQVTDHQDRVIYRPKPQQKLVMTREGAAIVTDMLGGVIREGTGSQARHLGGSIAGKTGTTDEYHDALFIGFSPAVAAGVWVGRDLGGTLGEKETGAKAALPIWINFMQIAVANGFHQHFDLPDSVIRLPINPDTGVLARHETDNSVQALFKKGTEPKE